MKSLKILASIAMVLGAIHVSLGAAEANVPTEQPTPVAAAQGSTAASDVNSSTDQKTCIPTPCVLHPDGVHCVCHIPFP